MFGSRKAASAALVVVASTVGLAGCGDDGGDELDLGADRPVITVADDRESGGAAVGDQAEPPPLETEGDDFDAIVRSLHRFELWLLGHPDSPLGTEIYQPESPASQVAFTVLVDLNQRGVRSRIVGSEVLSVEVQERVDDNTVRVRYTDTRTAREEVDLETGQVVDREEYDPKTWVFDATLRRGFDGKWRFDTVGFVENGELPG